MTEDRKEMEVWAAYLPAKIPGVGDAHVHTIAAGGDVLVRGVTSQIRVALGRDVAPRNCNIRSESRTHEDLVDGDTVFLAQTTEDGIHCLVRINLIGIRIKRQEHMHCPRIDLILSNERAAHVSAN